MRYSGTKTAKYTIKLSKTNGKEKSKENKQRKK